MMCLLWFPKANIFETERIRSPSSRRGLGPLVWNTNARFINFWVHQSNRSNWICYSWRVGVSLEAGVGSRQKGLSRKVDKAGGQEEWPLGPGERRKTRGHQFRGGGARQWGSWTQTGMPGSGWLERGNARDRSQIPTLPEPHGCSPSTVYFISSCRLLPYRISVLCGIK